MLYAALLLPGVLMASLFVMARLEHWLGRDSEPSSLPIPAARAPVRGPIETGT
ncbi:MAG: hypothetical protein L0Y54_20025 [Sporichthyaceae bacterium]|nr:hypothetical protein [Sporichthyaceae bacterium]